MTEDRTRAGDGGEQDLRDTSSTDSGEPALDPAVVDVEQKPKKTDKPKKAKNQGRKSGAEGAKKAKAEKAEKHAEKKAEKQKVAVAPVGDDDESGAEGAPVALTKTADGEADTPTSETTSAEPAPRRPDRTLVRVAAVLALAGLVLAIIGGVLWYRADHDESLQYAQTRDEVLVEAKQDIETLNTLDSDDVDGAIAAWKKVSTGDFLTTLDAITDEERQTLAAGNTESVGRVIDEAVVDLDARAGRATVIAAVEVTVTPKESAGSSESPDPSASPSATSSDDAAAGEPVVKRNRYQAELTRDDDGQWLLSDLQQVGVSAT